MTDTIVNDYKLEIITSFFLHKQKKRLNELVKCLSKNLNSQYVNMIHLFLDTEDCISYLKNKFKDLYDKKIKIIRVGKQPKYSDLFLYCNNLKQKNCFITNSDIWIHSIDNVKILKH